jgi:hypothetical protein
MSEMNNGELIFFAHGECKIYRNGVEYDITDDEAKEIMDSWLARLVIRGYGEDVLKEIEDSDEREI